VTAKIIALIVAYQPEAGQLGHAIAAIASQVDGVVVVCNSAVDDSQVPPEFESRVEIIRNPKNVGLAAAQNAGLRRCARGHAEFVLFLDQDSLPAADMVAQLMVAHRRLTDDGEKIAAVAPLLVDAATAVEWPFPTTHWFHTQRTTVPDRRGVCTAEFLYSSGSLVAMDVLLRVGGFIETLFIDHVDLEWCMRAYAHGYLCFGVPAVRMKHRMGSGHVRMFGRLHPIHTAERDYYVFRNSIILLRLPHIGLRWKLNEILRLLPRAVFYSTLHAQPLRHLAACLRGIREGFITRDIEASPLIHG